MKNLLPTTISPIQLTQLITICPDFLFVPMSSSPFKLLNYHLEPLYNCRLLFHQYHSALRFRDKSSLISPLRTSPSSRFLSVSNSSTLMDGLIAVTRHGSATGERVAIRADQKSYSYSQLLSSARKISGLLCNSDIKPAPSGVIGAGYLGGARIGIVAKPSAEFVAGVLGTWFSGGVAVPLALSYPEAELLHVMNDSDIAMVLSTDDYSDSMKNIAAKSAAHFSLIPTVPSSSSQPDEVDANKSLSLNKVEGEDPALIVYTSGTTGKPKGVVHTHKSISAQVKILADAWEYTSSDQFLNSLPLHHVHGLFNALFAPLYAGSTVEFMPKFSVRGIWQRFRESYPTNGTKSNDAITVFTGVPTMYTRLIQGYDAMDSDLQSISASASAKLRLMMCGSSAMPYPVMKKWETITGHRLLERYGMTEFIMAIANPLRGERKPGTVGKPFPGVEVKIVAEEESGADATGVGELCVRSPSLFKEYWKLPEVTKESFIDGGFFKTGDTVRVDEDGYYIILGRTSADIMKVGGYKLSALDIESVLLEHPVIAECSVFGLPDKDYGEAVCVVVVAEADAKKKQEPAITLEELCAWAKHRLAPYKLPTKLFLWDSVPRNAMGKVNKKELKKMVADKEQ